jgi:hypothetical protein
VVFLTIDCRIWMNLHNFSTRRQPLLTGDWVLYAWGTKCYTRRWSWGGPTHSGNIWQGTRTACSAGSNACGQGFAFEVALREAGKRRSMATSQRTFPGTGMCYGEVSWGRCPTIGIRVPVLGDNKRGVQFAGSPLLYANFFLYFLVTYVPRIRHSLYAI